MSPKEVLEKVYEKISKKENWCQGVAARNRYQSPVDSLAQDAQSWCVMGALGTIVGEKDETRIRDALRETMAAFEGKHVTEIGVGTWNDQHTHEEVLEAIRVTIVRLRFA